MRVPSAAGLALTFGLTCPDENRCSGSARFTLTAERDGSGNQVLARESISWRNRNRCWQTFDIDLHELADKTVDLQLSVEANIGSSTGASETIPPTLLVAEPLWTWRPPNEYRNVILISIDTLRSDHLGSYGYPRATSPHLDALAADAVRFSNAISQASWTTPAHMTLMTSLYPSTHQVNQPFTKLRDNKNQYRILPKGVPTLAHVLRQQGYRTVALTAGPTLVADLGFSPGFDVYHDYFASKLSERTWTRLLGWLDRIEESPFLLFFHTFEVHGPLVRSGMLGELLSESDIERFEDLRSEKDVDGLKLEKLALDFLVNRGIPRQDAWLALYDSAILHADRFMGRFFDELKKRRLYDSTLIIVTSDHGEEFGERRPRRYRVHGYSLYSEMVRVPLILRMPGRFEPGTTISQPVGLIDVMPTILDLLDVPSPAGIQGQSLVPLVGGSSTDPESWALSEATSYGPELKAIRNEQYKYIAAFEPVDGERSGIPGAPVWERLFDLDQDPGERQSLHGEDAERLRLMRRRLVRTFEVIEPLGLEGQSAVVDEEMRDRLRALGYID